MLTSFAGCREWYRGIGGRTFAFREGGALPVRTFFGAATAWRGYFGRRFVYDAENHQVGYYSSGNGGAEPDAVYRYDGDGKRVKKVVPATGEATIFVYNASGQLVAEYSTVVEPQATAKVSYLTMDHLGSPRVVTDAGGAVVGRKDFSAYGEEISTPQRVQSLGYQPVGVRQDYTGYLKDEESGLEFAEARYYNPVHGRFTSVDPLTASATVRNPQTFNRYAYALNSPYKFTDPLGLVPTSLDTRFGGDSGFCSASNASCKEGEDITTESIQAYQKKQQEKEKKRQEERQKKREENRRKRQEPKKPAPPPPPRNPIASENAIAEMFGGPGAYFSNPNDGDPFDLTIGISRNSPESRTDPHNHLYPSANDPSGRGSFYVPDGGQLVGMSVIDSDGSGEQMLVPLIYFKKLGEMRDVTVAVFHLVNIDKSMSRDETGRRRLGDMDIGAGGGWSYRSTDVNGKSVRTLGVHAHLEIYRGRVTNVPALGRKPHTNFNGVVP